MHKDSRLQGQQRQKAKRAQSASGRARKFFATFTASCDFHPGNLFWLWATDQILSTSKDSPVSRSYMNVSGHFRFYGRFPKPVSRGRLPILFSYSNSKCYTASIQYSYPACRRRLLEVTALPTILRPNVKTFWRVWTQVFCTKEFKNTQKQ